MGVCACVGATILLLFTLDTAAAESKRVMMLHSFGRDSKPWSDYAKNIRGELDRQSPWPLDITEHPLLAARSGEASPDAAFAEYLRALYAERPLDLIVSFGAPAVAFVQRHRQQLFATTPMIFTAVEQRRVQYSILTSNDTVVAVAHSFPAIFENILRVLPDTTTIAMVSGNSPNERFWAEEMRREGTRFANRISFVWYNDLPFEEVLKRAAELPTNSAIYWHLVNVDAAGVVHDNDRALRRLYAVANAPIFSYHDTFFGLGVVGGPMHSLVEGSRGTAAVAIRILSGEKPSDIKIPATGFATPKFDWREMQRWGISERRLLPGSEIYFRDPSAWDRYRVHILLACAVFLLQSALISWLFYQRRKRSRSEAVAPGHAEHTASSTS